MYMHTYSGGSFKHHSRWQTANYGRELGTKFQHDIAPTRKASPFVLSLSHFEPVACRITHICETQRIVGEAIESTNLRAGLLSTGIHEPSPRALADPGGG